MDQPKIIGPHLVNDTIYIHPNETADLTCEFEGNPDVVNVTVLENEQDIPAAYGGKGIYNFKARKGGGNYTCIVSNDYLTKQTSVIVNATDFKGTCNCRR